MPRSGKALKPLDEPAHTITEVAGLLGCSRSHVERLIATGELEVVDVGAGRKRPAWRIPDRSLRAFLSRRSLPDVS